MKIAYVAGPYTARSPEEHRANIQRASEVAYDIARERPGWWPVCVHTMAHDWFGFIPEAKALTGDLELLERCDAVVLVKGWERSRGTLNEIRIAAARGIPVYRNFEAFAMGCPTTPEHLIEEAEEEVPF